MDNQIVTWNNKPYTYVGYTDIPGHGQMHIFQPLDGCSPIARQQSEILQLQLNYFPTPVQAHPFSFPESLFPLK
jgi:hypothetical protein